MAEQNTTKNAAASASLVERLVIPDLSPPDWIFFDNTPAGGKAYYNEKEDRTAIKYPSSIKLYYHRVSGTHDKWAINFMNCKVFEV